LRLMAFFKLTTDQAVMRLRWVMVGAMLFDKINTILGQPASYWQHPASAEEEIGFFHFFLSQGLSVYLLFSLVYIVVLFALVSFLPRKCSLIVIFAFILCHFLGASTWLAYRWHLGIAGPIVYGIILSAFIVLAAFSER
jgi:hypothetical protein